MSSVVAFLRRPGRAFYGWRVLALIGFMGALNNAFFSRGAALFLIPVEASLGLNRATSSLVFSLARSEGAVEGPVIGYLVDRLGARKILIIGIVLTGIGFLIFAASRHLWTFALAYLVFISMGATMAFQHAASATVNKWFSRYRVRAISINEASGNLGSTLLVPVIGIVIHLYSWQAAAVMAALAYLVILLPLAPLVKESPETMGLLPDGATQEQVAQARKAASEGNSAEAQKLLRFYDTVDFTVLEALRTPGYWFLLTGTMFRQVAKAAIQVHFVAIMVWKGLDIGVAGLVFALWLGMNVPSKLLCGFIGDRLPKQVILGGGMLLYALSLFMVLESSALWALVLSAVLGGMSEGITPVNWGAIGDYFGRRYYATLRGIINLSHSWALLLAPFLAGWWFDHHQNYVLTLAVSVAASLVSALLYVLMRRPKPPARAAAQTVAAATSRS
ncbi:MAG: MFS transporter [SAR202 cluster bacterium]|nr:MFS transporter [SAR202 cluster bacterium]